VSWWVIEDVELRAALKRAHDGEDPSIVEAELYANSRAEKPEPEAPNGA
jgi:hypothetical protein